MKCKVTKMTADGNTIVETIPQVVIVAGVFITGALSYFSKTEDEIIVLKEPVTVDVSDDIYREALELGLHLAGWSYADIDACGDALPEPDDPNFYLYSPTRGLM